MSGIVNISSSDEWQRILKASTIVVTDCKSTRATLLTASHTPSTVAAHVIILNTHALVSSLRRLVWPLQDDCAHLRVPIHQVLQARQDHLLQSQRRQPPVHRPVPRRQRHAYFPHLQEWLRHRDHPRRQPSRSHGRRRKGRQAGRCGCAGRLLFHARSHIRWWG